MTRYMVNATASFAAWVEVEADTPEDALEEARGLDFSSGWDFDPGTADFQFDVTPEVEVVT